MTDEQKAKTSFNGNWRQVRIFTSDFSSQWYLRLLKSVVIPFSEKFTSTPFWFTRYGSNISMGEKDDQGDTSFALLPPTHLLNGTHISIRLRFLPQAQEEQFLETLIKAPFWFSDFLDHDELHEFGGPRFCASSRLTDQSYRADVISKLLYAHSLFTLDCIVEENGELKFEDLTHSDRTDHNSSFMGIHHLICNASGTTSGDFFETFRQDTAGGWLPL